MLTSTLNSTYHPCCFQHSDSICHPCQHRYNLHPCCPCGCQHRYSNPQNILSFLTDYFNRCWAEGKIPSAWNSAIVNPLLKSGKNKTNPKSYRPISLTPHTGKVYERLIKARIEYHTAKHNIIPRCQAGFKKGRGCADHIVRLSSHIKKASAKGHPTIATFFDIKAAFDSVWLERLYHKLGNIGINGPLHTAIMALTQHRSIRVRVGASMSEEHKLDMGVPQGSIIAPILFNIMTHDIALINILYADDLTIWSTVPYKHFFLKEHVKQSGLGFKKM